MADWPFTPEEAKVAAGGFFGSLTHLYIVRPKTLVQGAMRAVIGMAGAWLLTAPVVNLTGFANELVAVAIGLTCISLAKKLLRFAEQFDFASVIKRGE